ncbi:MAG: AAA family ATPase [Solirubrobacteraceae bacterium]
MLTKLEVRGFKNLRDTAIDFGPFTCIAGPNGTGKSNIFDAIQLLSALADQPLIEAVEVVRGSTGNRSADPRDLFWSLGQDEPRTMSFAAEMIVPPNIDDDFGQEATATTTFLRYELEIGYELPTGLERLGRLVLLREALGHITQSKAPQHVRFPHSASRFRHQVVTGRRSGAAYISTDVSGDESVITVHQDGGSRGRPRQASATRAAATVVRTTSVKDEPTILAARREMQHWRRLSLEPSALRTEDRYTDQRSISADGRHLASALYRIATTANGQGVLGSDTYARVASRLRQLSGVDVDRIFVDADDTRELLTLRLRERSGREFPARSLSEGTLRFLALCVMHEDSSVGGLICMEEPENGIHPANVGPMVDLVRDLAVDPTEEPGPDNPLRQVIVNTHSPAVVQLVGEEDLLMASTEVIEGDGVERAALRLRPMKGSWRAKLPGAEPVGKADLIPYLTAPAGSQIKLEE